MQGLRAPRDAAAQGLGHPVMPGVGLSHPLQPGPALLSLPARTDAFPGEELGLGDAAGRPGYQPWLLGVAAVLFALAGVCSLCPWRVGGRAGSLPGGKGGSCAGKRAPCGSRSLKCWENLERGIGGRGQSNVWLSWDARHGI